MSPAHPGWPLRRRVPRGSRGRAGGHRDARPGRATGLDPEAVDDVILGQCYPNGEAPAIGRVAALDAGLPVESRGCSRPALWVRPAGGDHAAMAVDRCRRPRRRGRRREHQPGGALLDRARWGSAATALLHDRLARAGSPPAAATTRYRAGCSRRPRTSPLSTNRREAQDQLALRSHQRAVAAQEDGRFAEEIVPVGAPQGPRAVVDSDEHPRAETRSRRWRRCGRSWAARRGATVTAGNASGQNDAAAVCVVTTPSGPPSSGCRPRPPGRLGGRRGAAAHDGHRAGPGHRKALGRAGIDLATST